MKLQQVSVDYWAMGKAMFLYGFLAVMGWVMMRLFSTAFTLPRRLRAQQNTIQNTLQELQRRFPDLNITEEDLKNAEKELEEILKENEKEKGEDEEQEKEGDIKEVESEAAVDKNKPDKETEPTASEAKKII